MKPFRSLRLRITLLCALLLTLCCAALAVTSNLSAIHLTDTIAAAPLSPALDPEAAAKGTMPLLTTQAAPVVQQAQQLFQIQSILASTVILATGLLLIYLLVGRALAPLKDLNDHWGVYFQHWTVCSPSRVRRGGCFWVQIFRQQAQRL